MFLFKILDFLVHKCCFYYERVTTFKRFLYNFDVLLDETFKFLIICTHCLHFFKFCCYYIFYLPHKIIIRIVICIVPTIRLFVFLFFVELLCFFLFLFILLTFQKSFIEPSMIILHNYASYL